MVRGILPFLSVRRWNMPNPVQEAAGRELGRAISADEQANTHYHQILRRFISGKAPLPDGKLPQPEARLDASSLKEISSAWQILNSTEKKLRNAYMKLYAAYLL
jgi:hypothetical protein